MGWEEQLRQLLAQRGGGQPVGPGSGQYAQGVGAGYGEGRVDPVVWEFGVGTPYEGSSFTQEPAAGNVRLQRASVASAPMMETPETVTDDPAGEAEEMMKSSEYVPIEDRVARGESLGNTMLESGAGPQSGYMPAEQGGFGDDFQKRLMEMFGGGGFGGGY